MGTHKKLNYITYLSSFAIFLVVLGHSLIYMNDHSLVTKAFIFLHNLIYSFHIPLFIFTAGYLLIHTNIDSEKFDYLGFVRRKAVRLLLPYVIISSAVFIPKAIFSDYALRAVDLSLHSYISNIIYPNENVIINYWFLPTLFLIFCIFGGICLKTIKFRNNALPVALLTLILLYLHFYNPLKGAGIFNVAWALSFAIYFWMGCLFYIYKEKLVFLRNPILLMAMTALILVMTGLEFHNKYFSLIRAFAGIIFAYSLVLFLDYHKLAIFSFMDGYSYQIYLLSWIFETPIRIACYQILHMNYYLVFVLILFGGLILPIFASKLIVRYAPRLKLIIGMN